MIRGAVSKRIITFMQRKAAVKEGFCAACYLMGSKDLTSAETS